MTLDYYVTYFEKINKSIDPLIKNCVLPIIDIVYLSQLIYAISSYFVSLIINRCDKSLPPLCYMVR